MTSKAFDRLRTIKEGMTEADRSGTVVTVHLGTCGISAGASRTLAALKDRLRKEEVPGLTLRSSGCAGLCSSEPQVTVRFPDGGEKIFLHVTEDRAGDLLEMCREDRRDGLETIDLSAPFYSKQMLVAMRNRGKMDPHSIDEAVLNGAYESIAGALDNLEPSEVIRQVTASGLRGRGGGGFPAGVKWKSCADAVKKTGKEPVVVCNADEGDPGAYMDRSLLESDPHSILEGMMLGAYAIGASEGYVYVRKEYPLALSMLNEAIAAARELGLLGRGILGTDFSFDVKVHRGAGAFVCGESSALMASMAGLPGEPKAKYIHTVESGFRDRPTVLNNVETWANVPVIIGRGPEWFASIGTGDVSENPWNGSSGTKVFSLVGDVKNAGLIEVPMGISLKEIIYDIGGGIPEGREFKAVQTGGPSGGVLPADKLDLPVDFDTLTEAGSMMGSGGMVVMDDETCMVQVAKYFVDFLKDESCGKCTPCREGLVALGTILERIIGGEGRDGDLELLEEYGRSMTESSLCALGQTAANPVLSTLEYFRDEYDEHIGQSMCRALQCKELIEYLIDPEKCTGCTLCAQNCPSDAITGSPREPHVIDQDKCIHCGVCREVCNFSAVEVR